jgi:hypothetical protein
MLGSAIPCQEPVTLRLPQRQPRVSFLQYSTLGTYSLGILDSTLYFRPCCGAVRFCPLLDSSASTAPFPHPTSTKTRGHRQSAQKIRASTLNRRKAISSRLLNSPDLTTDQPNKQSSINPIRNRVPRKRGPHSNLLGRLGTGHWES